MLSNPLRARMLRRALMPLTSVRANPEIPAWARRLGIGILVPMSKRAKPKWTDEQVNLLRELYPLGAIDEIVQRTGRSRQAVKHMAIALGLSGKYHWRGTPLPLGTEVLRGGENSYVMVKALDDAGRTIWIRKHHLEEHTGALPPKGTRVLFKDGDRGNCDFGNLELITDVEAATRMTELRSYPPALQETIRLLGELRKALYDREKHGRSSRPVVRSDAGIEDIGSP